MKIVTVAALIFFLAASAFSQMMTDLDKLVATERAFARAAAEKSTKEAFLEFLADDSIVFEAGPVNGKEVWSKRPPSVGLLSWEPVWADISADGSIGYTTGPWDFRPKGKDGDPVAFGEYVTIWKKQKDGNFKAILDIGISHGKPEGKRGELAFASNAARSESKPTTFLELGVRVVDRITDETRVYRDGELPILGDKVPDRLAAEVNEFENGAICSGLADFRYCYGVRFMSYGKDKRVKGNFLQIHRYHAGRWKIVLDLFAKRPE